VKSRKFETILKETPMTDEETKALIASSLKTAIDAAIKPLSDTLAEMAKNQKILGDTLAADKQKSDDAAKAADAQKAKDADAAKGAAAGAKPDAAKGEPAKALTQEDIAKLISDGIGSALKARDTEAQSSAARNAFVAEKLKGIPAVYAARLGNDPAKWATEEQSIRETFKADLLAAGATIKDVGGGNPGGGASDNKPAANPLAMSLTAGQAAFAQGLKLPG
jgi:ribosomal protein L19E